MEKPTTDIEIRTAFHKKHLKKVHLCPDTIVIDELGIEHGKQRIDIAVLNGELHGYEIKSSKDNLSRLKDQLASYIKYFEKLTIVTAEIHLNKVLEMAPTWVEIIIASKGERGAIHFKKIRGASVNHNVKVNSLLHLLWKKEALELLSHVGVKEPYHKKSRVSIYERISREISFKEALEWTKRSFNNRTNWRFVQ